MIEEVWERMDGEPMKAYLAFQHYLRERSINKAWCASKGLKRKPGEKRLRASGTWQKWSVLYDWVDRAAAYDAYLADQDRLHWEQRRKELREKDWEQANALREVVEMSIPEATRFIRERSEWVRNEDTGERQQVVTIQFDITALAQVLERASKLQHQATDGSPDSVKLAGAVLDRYINSQLARLAGVDERSDI